MFDWFITRIPILVAAVLLLGAVGGVVTYTNTVTTKLAVDAAAARFAAVVNDAGGALSAQRWEFGLAPDHTEPRLPREVAGQALQVRIDLTQVLVTAGHRAAGSPVFVRAEAGFGEDPDAVAYVHFWDPSIVPRERIDPSTFRRFIQAADAGAPHLDVSMETPLRLEVIAVGELPPQLFVFQATH